MNTLSRKQYVFVLALMIASSFLGAILSSAIVTAQSNPNRAQQTTSSAPASMQKWDYRIISGNPRDVQQGVQELGGEGYEAVGFAATADDTGRQGLSVLLRRARP